MQRIAVLVVLVFTGTSTGAQDDAVFARRPFTTSPPFPDLDLTPGGPFEDERFPVVWPVSARR